jgi:hypothetical protein
MAEKDSNAYNKFLDGLTTEEIEKQYHDGDISAQVYVNRTRSKARLELSKLEQGNSFVRAVLIQSKKNFMEAWESVVDDSAKLTVQAGEAALKNPNVGNLVTAVGAAQFERLKAVWGLAQMMFAMMGSGFGDVFGMRVENNALRQGYSAGAARVFGIIADTMTGNVVPVGSMARAVGAGGKALAGTKAMAKIAGTASSDAQWMRAIAEGMALDGVDEPLKVMDTIARQAGKPTLSESVGEVADLGKQLTKEPSSPFMETARGIASMVSLDQARTELPGLMKKFGISYPDLKTIKNMWRGTDSRAMDARDFYSYLKAMEEQVGTLRPLAQRAIAEDATLGEQQAFARAATELLTGPKEKLAYSKDFVDLLLHWDPVNVANGNLDAAMKTFATDMANVSADKLGKFSFKSQDGYIRFGQVMPAVKEVFVNLLLPLAGIPAFLGNSYGAVNTILERAGSGNFKEAAYMMKGMAWATADATRAIGMSYGTSEARGVIPGLPGRFVRFLGSDTMVAMDAAFKVIVARGAIYGDAIRAGLSPGSIAFRDFVQNPPGKVLEDAVERAYRATYQNDLGRFMSQWSSMARSGPGSFYFTFMKSPINLVKFGWDRTPGLQYLSGRLWQDIKGGGAMADDAMARLTMSQLQAMMVWELAKDGFITGGGPVDPKLRKAWRMNHEPYSLRTSAGWVPLGNMDPIVMPIALVADIAQIADQLGDPAADSDNRLEQLSLAAAFSFMRNVADRTSWRTISELVDTVQGVADAKRWSRRDTASVLAPLISTATGGSLVQRTEGITDPVQRDARNMYDQFRKRIPGYSEEVPPLRDGLGDPVIPPTTVGSPWFGYMSPLVPKLKPFQEDPLKKEADRVQATLPQFADFIGAPPRDSTDITQPLPGDEKVGVALTPQQRDRWQQLYSNIVRHPEDGLANLVNSPEYKSWPLARQRLEFNNYIKDAKSFAKENLLTEDTELAKKVQLNEMKNILPTEQPEDRQAVQEDYKREINLIDEMSPEELANVTKYGYMGPDKPFKQDSVTIQGVEILGPRVYTPKAPDVNLPKTQGGAVFGANP